MAEYIEKRLALEELENLRQKCEMHDDCDELIARKCKKAVSLLPVADVAPVVHTNWERVSEPDEDGNVWYRCPVCLHNDKQSPSIYVPYCWYCGAKMDG